MESQVQTRNCILDKQSMNLKLRRMALEVAERYEGGKELIVAGINGNGEVVARCLINELKRSLPIPISQVTIRLNKKDPFQVSIDPAIPLDGKIIILADDVANSGRTMFYAMKPFLNARPEKVQTLVLVERSHKLFPIQTDYVGLSLATTLQEHITVETDGDSLSGAWLY